MRSYVHDDQKTQKLFASIINRLSHGGSQVDIILGLLKEVCEHFHFASGLVYEADHTGDFILQEHYSVYNTISPTPSLLRLPETLEPREIKHLLNDRMFVIQPQVDESYASERLGLLFAANSLIACPVLSDDRQLGALVVMLDRRGKILLTPESVETAKTVLRLVSTHVRLRLAQKQLSLAYKSLGAILDNLGIDVYVSDYETREVLFVNRSMAAPYGGRKAIVGRKCFESLTGGNRTSCDICPHDRLVDADGKPSASCTWEYHRPHDDTWQRVYSTAFPWVDGRLAQLVTSVDISESKHNQELINRQAYYDQLTQLPNRRKLYLDCEMKLPELLENGDHAWLLFFDLDNFKNVNDTLGHQAGDELLQQVGRIFNNDPDIRDHFYRLGGDEFILFLEKVSRKYVLSLVDKLLLLTNRPWALTAGKPICRTSIGISRFPDDGQTVEELLHKADQVLYQAKDAGKGRAFFTDGKYSRSVDRLLKCRKVYRNRPVRKKNTSKARTTARERSGAKARCRSASTAASKKAVD